MFRVVCYYSVFKNVPFMILIAVF